MIEYITETGIFGILWVLIFFMFIYLTPKCIGRNPRKSLESTIPLFVFFFISHRVASSVLGIENGKFDDMLILVKDSWFIMGPTIFVGIIFLIDPTILDDIKFLNKGCKTKTTCDKK